MRNSHKIDFIYLHEQNSMIFKDIILVLANITTPNLTLTQC